MTENNFFNYIFIDKRKNMWAFNIIDNFSFSFNIFNKNKLKIIAANVGILEQ